MVLLRLPAVTHVGLPLGGATMRQRMALCISIASTRCGGMLKSAAARVRSFCCAACLPSAAARS
eukprot:5292534-Lingulodinium_polyedra.AAC.1